MARALQGPAAVLLAYMLFLAIVTPSLAAGKQNLPGMHCPRFFRNCAICTPGNRECAACKFGYTFHPRTRKICVRDPSARSTCQNFFTNCAKCSIGFTSCEQCVFGYVINTTTKECAEDLSGPKCQRLFPNCATCTSGFRSCAQCANAIKVSTRECLDISSGNIIVDDATSGDSDSSVAVLLGFDFICQTFMGAPNSCTLGALAPGLYTLSLTCLEASNGKCHMRISSLASNTVVLGSSLSFVYIAQGNTVELPVTVLT